MKEERILTRHPQGKDGVNILERRYDVIKEFIIETIKEYKEITYEDLNDLAVELDLEARKIIERIPKTSHHKLRMKK